MIDSLFINYFLYLHSAPYGLAAWTPSLITPLVPTIVAGLAVFFGRKELFEGKDLGPQFMIIGLPVLTFYLVMFALGGGYLSDWASKALTVASDAYRGEEAAFDVCWQKARANNQYRGGRL